MSRKVYGPPRTDFGPPPPGYIPGLGRGATGFTSRASEKTNTTREFVIDELLSKAGVKDPKNKTDNNPTNNPNNNNQQSNPSEDGKYLDSNFDQFSGYGNEGLFTKTDVDAEDKEAEEIYDKIDQLMANRTGKRKNQTTNQNDLDPNKKVSFDKEKSNLGNMKLNDWESIPESLDYSHRNQLTKQTNTREKFSVVPDSILAAGMSKITSLNTVNSIEVTNTSSSSGTITSLLSNSGGDLTSIGRARDKMLSASIDRVKTESVLTGSASTIDPTGYITQMQQSQQLDSTTDISDVKKARLLLTSVIKSNPKHPPGHIMLARFEKEVSQIESARKIIMQACEICPLSEDIWLEAASLHNPQEAKSILARAVRLLPNSINIWIGAAQLETEKDKKKLVFRRAIENIPNSVRLWKCLIELESETEAKILLEKAVELVPESVELWLAWARLEEYDKAKKILNKARKQIPTDISIWIAAAKLEETHGQNPENIKLIIEKAIKSLAKYEVRANRELWLIEAEKTERGGFVLTNAAIIESSLSMGIDPIDIKNTWLADATVFESKKLYHTARVVYKLFLKNYPNNDKIWLKAIELEKHFENNDTQYDLLLEKATTLLPHIEIFWLMRAKYAWRTLNQVELARSILLNAFSANTNSEEIWLSAMKLEYEEGEIERARALLNKAREEANTARVWMKSAKLERNLNNSQQEFSLIQHGINKFPTYWKFYLMLAQYYIRNNNQSTAARETFKLGIKNCPQSIPIWLNYVEFELIQNNYNPAKARALIETARVKNPHNDELWLKSIEIEFQNNNTLVAQQSLAKALQECPNSALLWAYSISTQSKLNRKSVCAEALNHCKEDSSNSVPVFLALARFCWLERKFKLARDWFIRGNKLNPDYGDLYCYWYKFETLHGNNIQQNTVIDLCNKAQPTHGKLWEKVNKSVESEQLKRTSEQILKIIAESIIEIFHGEKILQLTANTTSNNNTNGVSNSKPVKKEKPAVPLFNGNIPENASFTTISKVNGNNSNNINNNNNNGSVKMEF